MAVNKCESENRGAVAAAEFWNLGLGTPHAVSAIHGVSNNLCFLMFQCLRNQWNIVNSFVSRSVSIVKILECRNDH